jgi:hypothetical protein
MSSTFEDDIEEMEDATSPQSSATLPSGTTLDDLCSYAPSRMCIYLPCKTMWPNASVDDRIDPRPLLDASGNPVKNTKGKVVMISASVWLAQNRSVEALTWDPGKPEFIRDYVVVDGGYIEKPGATTLNFYRPPPNIQLGDAAQAGRWVDHWKLLYPDDADHIIAWLACRVQRPGEKINHALVLGGAPKIGKDTLLEAVVQTVGEWNFQNIKLNHLVGRNNGFLKSLIVRLSEARDVGEGAADLYRLNDHVKDMLATPPSTLLINQKYINEYYVLNRVGMIVTSNHRDALKLPANDRRHYVAFSERRGEEFPTEFWDSFWTWYENGGFAHVAALLYQHDLSNFNPKAEPRKTDAFDYMVGASRGVAYGELADAIDELGNPPALTINELMAVAPSLESLRNPDRRKGTSHRLAECGYVAIGNPTAKDSLWRIKGQRQTIYVHEDIPADRRVDVAEAHRAKLNV